MAVVTEHYKTRADGMVLVRTYSDVGFMIERDGKRYNEAIDPAEFNRQYTETDELIDVEEATAEDYQAALSRLGVDV